MNDIDDEKSHPLEDVFDMEAGSTPFKFEDTEMGQLNERASAIVDPTTGELVVRKSDELTHEELEKEERIEDLHIDGQLEGIHNAALGAFEHQSRMAQEVDPRFSARNAEVAAQYLNIALNAVNSRVDSKFKRQKIRIAKKTAGAPGTVNNNVIVADRNELLKLMNESREKIIVDPEEKN